MKLKPLSAALLAVGALTVATAGAIDLPNWLKSNPTTAALQAGVTAKAAAPEAATPAPVPMLAAQGVPNYRAIFKQSGPAVVGVTVAGTHKASAEEQGLPQGMENDPFFKFFRGMPGFQGRGQQGGQVPFKGLGSGFIAKSFV